MANLRKLIASDITGGNLKESPFYETALDRIFALGTSDALGSALWRLKYANDRGSYERVVALLSHRAKSLAPTLPLRLRFVRVVLMEWLDENCRACGGRRFIMASDTHAKHSCTLCDGTGLRRYSDQWRMRQMGLDQRAYRKWERRFAALHQKIADADLQTWRRIAEELEWIDNSHANTLEIPEERATLSAVRAGDDGAKRDDMPESLTSSAAG